jgi:hypothetical protein
LQKIEIVALFFEKTSIFSRKIGQIAVNNDYNIDFFEN